MHFRRYTMSMDIKERICSFNPSKQPHLPCTQFLIFYYRYTSIDGQDASQPLPYNPSSSITSQVEESFATSLRQLRTDYLDSYILHSPLRTPQLTLEAWSVLTSLQDQGKVRLIGVSNTYDVSTLEMLTERSGRKIDVVQNRWFEGNNWDAEVAGFCRTQGIHYE